MILGEVFIFDAYWYLYET